VSFVLVTTSVDGPAPTTVVVVEAELFPGTLSVPAALTVAVFVISPAAVGVTTIETVI